MTYWSHRCAASAAVAAAGGSSAASAAAAASTTASIAATAAVAAAASTGVTVDIAFHPLTPRLSHQTEQLLFSKFCSFRSATGSHYGNTHVDTGRKFVNELVPQSNVTHNFFLTHSMRSLSTRKTRIGVGGTRSI